MKVRTLLAWLAVGVAAAVYLSWATPRVTPFEPAAWEVSRHDAEAIALELLSDLGELPDGAFVVVNRVTHESLQWRLDEYLDAGGSLEQLRESRLFADLKYWSVTVFDPKAGGTRWAYKAGIAPTGRPLRAERWVEEAAVEGELEGSEARRRADALLTDLGLDPDRYAQPQLLLRDRGERTDSTLRYADRERLLGERFSYGMEVQFAGDRLMGFRQFFDDPGEADLVSRLQSVGLWQVAWIFVALLLAPLVAIPFMRRYHAGEVGVRRGLQIGGVMMALGLLSILFTARGISDGVSMGSLSKPVTAVALVFLYSVTFYLPMAVVGFLSWTVGESLSRQRWAHKLAGFDALFRGEWRNATFARASLRGLICGLLIVAVSITLLLLAPASVFAFDLLDASPGWSSTQWWGVPIFCFSLAYALYSALFGQLFLVPWLARKLGKRAGFLAPWLAVVASALLLFPWIVVVPVGWTLIASFVFYGLAMVVFLRYGVFASVLALFTAYVVPVALSFLDAGHPSMQLNAGLLLVAAALPALLSLRYLMSGKEFIYRYEDVPPHVRRIAERERQKVELETARGIQASILPELPPQLNGVQLSHRYLPASEVGGDFYDVLALEDGRLAVAVGDVAGHGVSSGLVMSMAKSALSVQVTFDPEVEAVFSTLNRMVYQSARRRLLTTLCYALIDPIEREMYFASAGHLFPYRVSRDGEVVPLESISYPLGVRATIDITTRSARLEAGDKLFLYSDGVIEACPETSSEPFGFDRLERSLAAHATKDVHGLRDGVLGDLFDFAGPRPLADDLTVLVLELP